LVVAESAAGVVRRISCARVCAGLAVPSAEWERLFDRFYRPDGNEV
jgi:signal transduction histidine kinase